MSSLNDSIKTPIVYLYSESGELLASTIEELELGIVEFIYEFDDEEEDTCTIRIQAKNKDAIDTLGIRRNSVLLVKWGYLGGPLGHTSRVAVRDIASKYGTNIIYTEYKCTDLTTSLKYVSQQDLRKMSLIDYIDNYVCRRYKVVIRSGPDVIYKQNIHNNPPETTETFQELSSSIGAVTPGWDPFITPLMNGIKPALPKPNPNNIIETGTWYTDMSNDIKEYYELERDLVSVNRSPYSVLQEYLNSCPNGPWFITGRGNTLLIHNRNLGNGVYKDYIYAGESGELMDFTAETKYDNFEKQMITSLTLDPNTKGVDSLDSYLKRLETQRSFPEIIQDKSITKEERDKQIKDFIQSYHDYKIYEIQVNEFKAFTKANPLISNYIDAQIAYNSAVVNGDVSFDEDSGLLAKRAQTGVTYVPKGQMNLNTEFQGYMGKVLIYSIPVDSPMDMENEQKNTLRKLEMETEEGTIIIEGDPYVTSEMVVGIKNVQKPHEGKYYIKKCTHTISEMGYKTSMEALKVKDSAIIKSLKAQSEIDKTKENEISMKLPDWFMKQENAFKKWKIRVRFKAINPSNNVTVPGTSMDFMNMFDIETLDGLLQNQKLNDDQRWAVIKKYLEDPNYEIYIDDNLITDPREL